MNYKQTTIIRLNAGNDNNGNPRRVYILLSTTGEIIRAYPEAYSGYNAVPEEFRQQARNAQTIPTTPKYYHDILKQYA